MIHDESPQPHSSGTERAESPNARTISRVVHVIDSLGRSGGAEQQLVANLRHFADPGLSHEVLCLYRGSTSREDDLPSGVGLSYLLSDGRRVRNRVALSVLMRRRLAAIRPDLIHCVLPDAALAARLAGRWLGIPVIESLVNIGHEEVRTVDSPAVTRWKLALHRWTDRWTMRSVVRFQALSQEVARSWVDTVGIRPARVDVIPRGVDTDRATPDADRSYFRARLLSELGLPADSFVVLNIGRQVAQKGQIYAINALPQILAAVPQAVFVSAGSSGPMTERLRDEARQLGIEGRVHWIGVREDVPDLMAAADVFVFPSLYEGLGVSLLQAMAAGLACVVTDRPPMTEVVSDGDTGLLVPPRDSGAIAAAVLRLAQDQDLRGSLAARARSHVARQFDSVVVAARIERMYQEILESRIS